MADPRTADALRKVLAQDARQAELDRLYDLDGRHDPHHPMHSLFTGLATQSNETGTTSDQQ